MEVARREQRKTVSEQRTASTEKREIKISVRPLESNDSQRRIGAKKQKKAIGEQVTEKKNRSAITKQLGIRTEPRETFCDYKGVAKVGNASS